jgi:hypothetical protein
MADMQTATPQPIRHDETRCGAGHKPLNAREALACLSQELEQLYERQDNRAIFLRAYYIMTLHVVCAIEGSGRGFDRPIFFDPQWVDRLVARFSQLYFEARARPMPRAWALADAQTLKRRSSVLMNLMLGINAHINHDLAVGIYELIVEEGDQLDPQRLARRKFDHDQINNVLARSLAEVQRGVFQDFGGALGLYSKVFGQFDEYLTLTALRHYRGLVWDNVLGFLAARDEEEREKVRLRLQWESAQLGEFIGSIHPVVAGLDGLLRRWPFRKLRLERPEGLPV